MPVNLKGELVDEMGKPTLSPIQRYTVGGGTSFGTEKEAASAADFIRAGQAGTPEGRALSGDINYRYTAPPAAPAENAGSAFGTAGIYANRKAPTPEEEQTIRETERTRVQSQIDAVSELAAKSLADARERAAQRSGSARARMSSTGEIGSGNETTVNAALDKQREREEKVIATEKAARVNSLLTGVEDRSAALIKAQKEEAMIGAEKFEEYLKDSATQARTDMQSLAKTGTKLTSSQRQNLINQTGYDPDTFDALYKSLSISNASAGEYINKDKPQIVGNKAIFFKKVKDPSTGAISIVPEEVNLPDGAASKEVKQIVSRDDGMYVFYENGTWEKIGEPKPADPNAALETENKRLQNEKLRKDINGEGDGTVTTTVTDPVTGEKKTVVKPSGTAERDADSIMSGTLNLTDTSTKDNYRGSVAAVLRKKQDEALAKGDFEGVMRASAAYDKEPGDTFLTSMEKTSTVIQQIETLQKNVEGVATGPIVGAFRSANPWDTKAQTIKAQLNAIVPNLARGIYGEVGVLTDNDIKNYAKTIPNLSSTEDIRNAILYITVDQIKKNIQTKIKNQAAGQRDMSGYVGMYQELTSLAESILSKIPPAGASKEQPKLVEYPIGSGKKYNVDAQGNMTPIQ